MKLSAYAKAVWAFLSSAVGAVTTAVAATPDHAFSQVSSLGWLIAAGSVLFIVGGVYGLTNTGQPTSVPMVDSGTAEREAKTAALRQQIADLQGQLSRIGTGG